MSKRATLLFASVLLLCLGYAIAGPKEPLVNRDRRPAMIQIEENRRRIAELVARLRAVSIQLEAAIRNPAGAQANAFAQDAAHRRAEEAQERMRRSLERGSWEAQQAFRHGERLREEQRQTNLMRRQLNEQRRIRENQDRWYP